MSDLSSTEKTQKILEVLNTARRMELYSIHQYMNQHYTLDGLDYGEFAAKIKLIAIDEMRHAEELAERIKALGGEPTTSPEGTLEKNQSIQDIYPFNDNLEVTTIERYNEFLKTCRECDDSISSRLFAKLIEEEQIHDDYFAVTAEHIKNLGTAYLARIAGTSSSTGLAPAGFIVGAMD